MRRSARLQSARSWLLERGGGVRAGEYARRYGVDRCAAYDELKLLGAAIHPKDARRATRPRPVFGARKARAEPAEDRGFEWVDFGRQRILAVGYTSAGCPYGAKWEEVEGVEPAPVDPDEPPF